MFTLTATRWTIALFATAFMLGLPQQSIASNEMAREEVAEVGPSLLATTAKVVRDAAVVATTSGLLTAYIILTNKNPDPMGVAPFAAVFLAPAAALYTGGATLTVSSIVRGYQYLKAKSKFNAAKKAQGA